jgi:hypothetical protein
VQKQFTITLLTGRLTDTPPCSGALGMPLGSMPFTRTFPLSVIGLEAGTYTVIAESTKTTFELSMDNQLDFSGDKG